MTVRQPRLGQPCPSCWEAALEEFKKLNSKPQNKDELKMAPFSCTAARLLPLRFSSSAQGNVWQQLKQIIQYGAALINIQLRRCNPSQVCGRWVNKCPWNSQLIWLKGYPLLVTCSLICFSQCTCIMGPVGKIFFQFRNEVIFSYTELDFVLNVDN